jgi:predicted dehydrogenase
MFQGPESYKQIANCQQCDLIIISSPDYFHVQHLEAVVDAGKHCYCEKPAGVDVESCRKFIEIGERAEGKLSLEIGFNVRYAPCFYEVVNRIHNGDIGTVSRLASLSCLIYWLSNIPMLHPGKTHLAILLGQDLSGDTIVDQFIHTIDMANWVMVHPEKAIGTGGRRSE